MSNLMIKLQEDFLARKRESWNGRDILTQKEHHPDPIILDSNDYLSMSHEIKIHEAKSRGLDKIHMQSPFFVNGSGQSNLEEKLAKHIGYGSCLITSSGYAANIGLMHILAKSGHPIYVDHKAHMSIHDGLKDANSYTFKHNSIDHLKRKISSHGPGFIVVDSVYSVDGDIAPLKELVTVADENQCDLIVDESHSYGLYGTHGQGLVNHLGLQKKVAFITSSLAKAFASRAGAIFCSKNFRDTILYSNHASIFSTYLTQSCLNGLEETYNQIVDANGKRIRLASISSRLRNKLQRLGFALESTSHIMTIVVGTEEKLMEVNDFLRRRGIYASTFFPPATSIKKCCIRLNVNASLTDFEVERIVSVVSELKRTFDL